MSPPTYTHTHTSKDVPGRKAERFRTQKCSSCVQVNLKILSRMSLSLSLSLSRFLVHTLMALSHIPARIWNNTHAISVIGHPRKMAPTPKNLHPHTVCRSLHSGDLHTQTMPPFVWHNFHSDYVARSPFPNPSPSPPTAPGGTPGGTTGVCEKPTKRRAFSTYN